MTNLLKISMLFLVLTGFASFSGIADAQLRLPFGRGGSAGRASKTQVESDPAELSEKAGPWLIMCASFSADEGAEQAHQLCQELQAELGLPAYVHRQSFNFNRQVAGKALGWQNVDAHVSGGKSLIPKRMKLASEGEYDEIAVLVGDFPMVDDGRAQAALKAIKSIKPRSLGMADSDASLGDHTTTSDRIRAFRDKLANSENASPGRPDGPLRQAFLLPNPLLPDAYFNEGQIDSFVTKMNRGLRYSLLKNKGMYTIRVATFGGERTLDADAITSKLKKMEWMKNNGKSLESSKLVTAAKRASLLARHLRKRDIEAYEFHDREKSYVCVGSFDWATRQSATGGTETNPEVQKMLNLFAGDVITSGPRQGAIATFELPAKFAQAGVACAPNPEPMLVPRSQVASTASRFLGKFR